MNRTDSRRAGGYRVTRGCTRYPNLKHSARKPWLTALRKHVALKLAQKDEATERMVCGSDFLFNSLRASAPNRTGCGKVGTPAVRAATLIAHILKQGRRPILPSDKGPARARYSAFDILVAGLAAQIQWKHDGDVPLRSEYYRAVTVGRAIHHYLRRESRTYTRDDGRGNVGEETVVYRRLELQSRNVCAQLEKLINECAYDWVIVEGRAVASRVARQQLRRYRRLNGLAVPQCSRSVRSSRL